MSRYLGAPLPEVSTDAPDIATTMRTNPRVKVILCSTGAAMLGLVVKMLENATLSCCLRRRPLKAAVANPLIPL